jgi:hypothetical protein
MTIETLATQTVDALLSEEGQAALTELAKRAIGEENTLPLLDELRRRFPPTVAGALLTLARLRRRATAKFPFADRLFLTPTALEQATAWPIALHRASWIDRFAPSGPVLDLGCGIGGDTVALAQYRPVIAIEQDPLRLRFAQANAAALGLEERVQTIQADWTELLASGQLPIAAAAFADPSRRVGERRVFSLYQIEPPLPALLRLQTDISALGVKVMPGVQDGELPPACGVEFISHEGVCKEAVLWFGSLNQRPRWASVYTGNGWETIVNRGEAAPLGPLAAGHYLYEPDPAVIRAGALGKLCERLGGWLFDPQIAYLIAPTWRPDALAQSFRVDEVHRFSLKTLNRRLQALGIGAVELKKRGFPVEPETLRPQLKLVPGGRSATVLITRRGDERVLVLGERMPKN